jgi:hypothetical protein
MDRTTPIGGSLTGSGNRANLASANPASATGAQAAHQTTDQIADKGTAQVDRLSGTAHRAVNSG